MNPWFTIRENSLLCLEPDILRKRPPIVSGGYGIQVWVITEVQMPCSNVDIQACITKALRGGIRRQTMSIPYDGRYSHESSAVPLPQP